jgi:hypothetical protein
MVSSARAPTRAREARSGVASVLVSTLTLCTSVLDTEGGREDIGSSAGNYPAHGSETDGHASDEKRPSR